MDLVTAGAERLIQGQGTPESAWLASPFLQEMPWVGLDALLGGATRLVVVSPHPDDEVLGCGGLMAACAARGLEVRVVAVTDGEHCYPGDPHWTPERLRQQRRGELQDALAALGLDPGCAVHLGVADGSVAGVRQPLLDQLEALLRPGDLVLCTWDRDGHPDHEAAAGCVARACAAVGAPRLQYPVWGWHWMPADRQPDRMPDARRLRLAPSQLAAKRRALDCFTTQTGRCDPLPAAGPILPAHVLARFARDFEVYFE